MKKRCIILIDGSNFYFKLKKLSLKNLLALNYQSFATFLAQGGQIIDICYYIGAIRTDGSNQANKLLDHQQRLFSLFRKQGVKYTLGYLLKTDGKYHEKGVDVQIAVDILIAAYEDLCEHIILISSDTDLIPAIKKAKSLGKTVEYVGFQHSVSYAMKAQCTCYRLLSKADIASYILKK